MLVLTRRPGEEIVIGDAIRVTVLKAKGGKIRLGITAPSSLRVDRQEVRDRRDEEAQLEVRRPRAYAPHNRLLAGRSAP